MNYYNYINNTNGLKKMITVIEAQMYSMKNEMAYQITYSDNTTVRVIESKDKTIRSEYYFNSLWIAGKKYVVKHNSKRQYERIKQKVLNYLK
jgi:hypothetical protein